jgi:transcriptional regulator with XRE-family HTH domain
MTEAKYVNPSYLIQDRRSLDPTLVTQLQISEMAGVSPSTVMKWAQSRLLPDPKQRVPRWNMPLYDKREVVAWLVETGRLVRDEEAGSE